MKKKIIGILIALLCLPISSCNNSKDDSNITVIESKDCYKTISVNIDNKNYRYPSFVEDIEKNEKEFHFIFDYTELEEVFEYSTKKEVEDYFDKDLFNDNFVLAIARKENIPDEYYYSGLSLYNEKIELYEHKSIEMTSQKVSIIDFAIIHNDYELSKNDIAKYAFNVISIPYEINKEKSEELVLKYYSSGFPSRLEDDNLTNKDIYVKDYLGSYNGAIAFTIGRKDNKYIKKDNITTGWNTSIEKYCFKNSNRCFRILVEKNNEIYYLENAYAQGILTIDDISKIHNTYSKAYPDIYNDVFYFTIEFGGDRLEGEEYELYFTYNNFYSMINKRQLILAQDLINEEVFIDNFVLMISIKRYTINCYNTIYSNFRIENNVLKIDEYLSEGIIEGSIEKTIIIIVPKKRIDYSIGKQLENNEIELSLEICGY